MMRMREKIRFKLDRYTKESEKVQGYIEELEKANAELRAKGRYQTKIDRNERQNNTEEILYSQGRRAEIKNIIVFLNELLDTEA